MFGCFIVYLVRNEYTTALEIEDTKASKRMNKWEQCF